MRFRNDVDICTGDFHRDNSSRSTRFPNSYFVSRRRTNEEFNSQDSEVDVCNSFEGTHGTLPSVNNHLLTRDATRFSYCRDHRDEDKAGLRRPQDCPAKVVGLTEDRSKRETRENHGGRFIRNNQMLAAEIDNDSGSRSLFVSSFAKNSTLESNVTSPKKSRSKARRKVGTSSESSGFNEKLNSYLCPNFIRRKATLPEANCGDVLNNAGSIYLISKKTESRSIDREKVRIRNRISVSYESSALAIADHLFYFPGEVCPSISKEFLPTHGRDKTVQNHRLSRNLKSITIYDASSKRSVDRAPTDVSRGEEWRKVSGPHVGDSTKELEDRWPKSVLLSRLMSNAPPLNATSPDEIRAFDFRKILELRQEREEETSRTNGLLESYTNRDLNREATAYLETLRLLNVTASPEIETQLLTYDAEYQRELDFLTTPYSLELDGVTDTSFAVYPTDYFADYDDDSDIYEEYEEDNGESNDTEVSWLEYEEHTTDSGEFVDVEISSTFSSVDYFAVSATTEAITSSLVGTFGDTESTERESTMPEKVAVQNFMEIHSSTLTNFDTDADVTAVLQDATTVFETGINFSTEPSESTSAEKYPVTHFDTATEFGVGPEENITFRETTAATAVESIITAELTTIFPPTPTSGILAVSEFPETSEVTTTVEPSQISEVVALTTSVISESTTAVESLENSETFTSTQAKDIVTHEQSPNISEITSTAEREDTATTTEEVKGPTSSVSPETLISTESSSPDIEVKSIETLETLERLGITSTIGKTRIGSTAVEEAEITTVSVFRGSSEIASTSGEMVAGESSEREIHATSAASVAPTSDITSNFEEKYGESRMPGGYPTPHVLSKTVGITVATDRLELTRSTNEKSTTFNLREMSEIKEEDAEFTEELIGVATSVSYGLQEIITTGVDVGISRMKPPTTETIVTKMTDAESTVEEDEGRTPAYTSREITEITSTDERTETTVIEDIDDTDEATVKTYFSLKPTKMKSTVEETDIMKSILQEAETTPASVSENLTEFTASAIRASTTGELSVTVLEISSTGKELIVAVSTIADDEVIEIAALTLTEYSTEEIFTVELTTIEETDVTVAPTFASVSEIQFTARTEVSSSWETEASSSAATITEYIGDAFNTRDFTAFLTDEYHAVVTALRTSGEYTESITVPTSYANIADALSATEMSTAEISAYFTPKFYITTPTPVIGTPVELLFGKTIEILTTSISPSDTDEYFANTSVPITTDHVTIIKSPSTMNHDTSLSIATEARASPELITTEISSFSTAESIAPTRPYIVNTAAGPLFITAVTLPKLITAETAEFSAVGYTDGFTTMLIADEYSEMMASTLLYTDEVTTPSAFTATEISELYSVDFQHDYTTEYPEIMTDAMSFASPIVDTTSGISLTIETSRFASETWTIRSTPSSSLTTQYESRFVPFEESTMKFLSAESTLSTFHLETEVYGLGTESYLTTMALTRYRELEVKTSEDTEGTASLGELTRATELWAESSTVSESLEDTYEDVTDRYYDDEYAEDYEEEYEYEDEGTDTSSTAWYDYGEEETSTTKSSRATTTSRRTKQKTEITAEITTLYKESSSTSVTVPIISLESKKTTVAPTKLPTKTESAATTELISQVELITTPQSEVSSTEALTTEETIVSESTGSSITLSTMESISTRFESTPSLAEVVSTKERTTSSEIPRTYSTTVPYIITTISTEETLSDLTETEEIDVATTMSTSESYSTVVAETFGEKTAEVGSTILIVSTASVGTETESSEGTTVSVSFTEEATTLSITLFTEATLMTTEPEATAKTEFTSTAETTLFEGLTTTLGTESTAVSSIETESYNPETEPSSASTEEIIILEGTKFTPMLSTTESVINFYTELSSILTTQPPTTSEVLEVETTEETKEETTLEETTFIFISATTESTGSVFAIHTELPSTLTTQPSTTSEVLEVETTEETKVSTTLEETTFTSISSTSQSTESVSATHTELSSILTTQPSTTSEVLEEETEEAITLEETTFISISSTTESTESVSAIHTELPSILTTQLSTTSEVLEVETTEETKEATTLEETTFISLSSTTESTESVSAIHTELSAILTTQPSTTSEVLEVETTEETKESTTLEETTFTSISSTTESAESVSAIHTELPSILTTQPSTTSEVLEEETTEETEEGTTLEETTFISISSTTESTESVSAIHTELPSILMTQPSTTSEVLEEETTEETEEGTTLEETTFISISSTTESTESVSAIHTELPSILTTQPSTTSEVLEEETTEETEEGTTLEETTFISISSTTESTESVSAIHTELPSILTTQPSSTSEEMEEETIEETEEATTLEETRFTSTSSTTESTESSTTESVYAIHSESSSVLTTQPSTTSEALEVETTEETEEATTLEETTIISISSTTESTESVSAIHTELPSILTTQPSTTSEVLEEETTEETEEGTTLEETTFISISSTTESTESVSAIHTELSSILTTQPLTSSEVLEVETTEETEESTTLEETTFTSTSSTTESTESSTTESVYAIHSESSSVLTTQPSTTSEALEVETTEETEEATTLEETTFISISSTTESTESVSAIHTELPSILTTQPSSTSEEMEEETIEETEEATTLEETTFTSTSSTTESTESSTTESVYAIHSESFSVLTTQPSTTSEALEVETTEETEEATTLEETTFISISSTTESTESVSAIHTELPSILTTQPSSTSEEMEEETIEETEEATTLEETTFTSTSSTTESTESVSAIHTELPSILTTQPSTTSEVLEVETTEGTEEATSLEETTFTSTSSTTESTESSTTESVSAIHTELPSILTTQPSSTSDEMEEETTEETEEATTLEETTFTSTLSTTESTTVFRPASSEVHTTEPTPFSVSTTTPSTTTEEAEVETSEESELTRKLTSEMTRERVEATSEISPETESTEGSTPTTMSIEGGSFSASVTETSFTVTSPTTEIEDHAEWNTISLGTSITRGKPESESEAESTPSLTEKFTGKQMITLYSRPETTTLSTTEEITFGTLTTLFTHSTFPQFLSTRRTSDSTESFNLTSLVTVKVEAEDYIDFTTFYSTSVTPTEQEFLSEIEPSTASASEEYIFISTRHTEPGTLQSSVSDLETSLTTSASPAVVTIAMSTSLSTMTSSTEVTTPETSFETEVEDYVITTAMPEITSVTPRIEELLHTAPEIGLSSSVEGLDYETTRIVTATHTPFTTASSMEEIFTSQFYGTTFASTFPETEFMTEFSSITDVETTTPMFHTEEITRPISTRVPGALTSHIITVVEEALTTEFFEVTTFPSTVSEAETVFVPPLITGVAATIPILYTQETTYSSLITALSAPTSTLVTVSEKIFTSSFYESTTVPSIFSQSELATSSFAITDALTTTPSFYIERITVGLDEVITLIEVVEEPKVPFVDTTKIFTDFTLERDTESTSVSAVDYGHVDQFYDYDYGKEYKEVYEEEEYEDEGSTDLISPMWYDYEDENLTTSGQTYETSSVVLEELESSTAVEITETLFSGNETSITASIEEITFSHTFTTETFAATKIASQGGVETVTSPYEEENVTSWPAAVSVTFEETSSSSVGTETTELLFTVTYEPLVPSEVTVSYEGTVTPSTRIYTTLETTESIEYTTLVKHVLNFTSDTSAVGVETIFTTLNAEKFKSMEAANGSFMTYPTQDLSTPFSLGTTVEYVTEGFSDFLTSTVEFSLGMEASTKRTIGYSESEIDSDVTDELRADMSYEERKEILLERLEKLEDLETEIASREKELLERENAWKREKEKRKNERKRIRVTDVTETDFSPVLTSESFVVDSIGTASSYDELLPSTFGTIETTASDVSPSDAPFISLTYDEEDDAFTMTSSSVLVTQSTVLTTSSEQEEDVRRLNEELRRKQNNLENREKELRERQKQLDEEMQDFEDEIKEETGEDQETTPTDESVEETEEQVATTETTERETEHDEEKLKPENVTTPSVRTTPSVTLLPPTEMTTLDIREPTTIDTARNQTEKSGTVRSSEMSYTDNDSEDRSDVYDVETDDEDVTKRMCLKILKDKSHGKDLTTARICLPFGEEYRETRDDSVRIGDADLDADRTYVEGVHLRDHEWRGRESTKQLERLIGFSRVYGRSTSNTVGEARKKVETDVGNQVGKINRLGEREWMESDGRTSNPFGKKRVTNCFRRGTIRTNKNDNGDLFKTDGNNNRKRSILEYNDDRSGRSFGVGDNPEEEIGCIVRRRRSRRSSSTWPTESTASVDCYYDGGEASTVTEIEESRDDDSYTVNVLRLEYDETEESHRIKEKLNSEKDGDEYKDSELPVGNGIYGSEKLGSSSTDGDRREINWSNGARGFGGEGIEKDGRTRENENDEPDDKSTSTQSKVRRRVTPGPEWPTERVNVYHVGGTRTWDLEFPGLKRSESPENEDNEDDDDVEYEDNEEDDVEGTTCYYVVLDRAKSIPETSTDETAL